MTDKKLPQNWGRATLEDVAEIHDNLREPVNSAERSKRHGPYPYYGATGQVGWIDDYRQDGEYILLGEDGAPFFDPTKEKAYLVSGKCWVNNHAHVLKASEGLCANRYLLYALNQTNYRGYANGTTRLKLTQSAMRQLPINLAPIPEQNRIVAKIEALFSELDKGIESFKTAREQLKIYRQALLKHAFFGKLTEQWRAENADAAQGGANAAGGQEPGAAKLESAEALLRRIQTERQQRYQQQLKDWEANGKPGSKPKAPKTLPPFTAEELAELPALPEGWFWIKSGELFESVTSGSRGWAEYYADSGAIFIRITNLDFDSLELDLAPNKIQYVHPPAGAEGLRTKVNEGDFLFSITGYLGMFAIAPLLENAYVNQHISLARPLNGFDKKYFGHYVTSHTGGIHFLNKQTKGAVKAGLGLEDIQTFPVPICSFSEQLEITERLESRLSEVDQLDQTITTALQQAEALRQSILKKAFSGQLVPQDPNDEPASLLLERIRAEKAQADIQPARRRGKTA